MTSSSPLFFTCVFAVLLLLAQPGVSDLVGDFLGPVLSPVIDVCKVVACGRGKCRATGLTFVCECDDGWKQSIGDQKNIIDDIAKMMPCVIPDCDLNSSCGSAQNFTQPKTNGSIGSFFDPCNLAICGEGSCNKTSVFSHECICKEGYANLLNVTTFPCLKECSIGADCLRLGIPIVNNTPHADPFLRDNSSGIHISVWSVCFVVALIISSSLMSFH